MDEIHVKSLILRVLLA